MPTRSVRQRMAARSTTLLNSLTLPGQWYSVSALEGLFCEAGEGVVVASAIEYQQPLRERHYVLRAFA